MVRHGASDDLVMDVEQPQHPGFVGAHLAAEADDIGEHDGGQAAGLASYGTRTVLGHGGIIG